MQIFLIMGCFLTQILTQERKLTGIKDVLEEPKCLI